MPRVQLPFVAGTYQSRSKSIDLQETINMYPERQSDDSKNISSFIGTPGLTLFLDTGATNAPRGFYPAGNGRLFYVNDSTLFEIVVSNQMGIIRGTLATFNGYVSIADNGTYLLLVDGNNGYVYNMALNTFEKITDANFPLRPTTCTYRDGYFIVNENNTNLFSCSKLADPTDWTTAIVKLSKETDSDPIVGIVSTPSYLWIFGNRTIELWYSTGDSNAPFARAQESNIDTGTFSANSFCSAGNTVFWLGTNPFGNKIIWMASGFNPTRISTHSIEYLIGQLPTIIDVTTYGYQQEGHFFYVFNFPSGGKTYVYDATTDQWHQRGYWNAAKGEYEAHLALFACGIKESVLACDRNSGKIYSFDLDGYSDNGDLIRRVRTISHTHKMQKFLYIFGVELDLQKGVGLEDGTDLDEDPQLSLSWSKDGGYTWSKEYSLSMGKIGKFKQRLIWPFGLGKSRDWIFRWVTMARVKIVLIAAYADIEEEAM